MIKAEELKAQNISEYIIHMYKSEDLVRTFEFDLTKITDYLIANIPVSASEKKEQILWYASLIENMQKEKIHTKGHLDELNQLVLELTALHENLLKKDETYKKLAFEAMPFIEKQIETSDYTITNPIVVCLNGIYGFLLLKINSKAVTDIQQEMLNAFGGILSYLSFSYKKDKK